MGENLILNHEFETDLTSWAAYNAPTTFEWVAGRCHIVSSGGVRGFNQVSVPVVNGDDYWLVFDYEVVSGELGYSLSGQSGSNLTGTGHVQVQFTAGASQTMQFHSDDVAAEFYIDNVHVERIDAMAFGTKVSLTIRDGKGEISNPSIYLESGAIVADIQETAQEFATLVDALIDGVIIAVSATIRVTLPGGLDAVDPNSDVEEGALFPLVSAGGFNARIRIPTFDETLMLSGTSSVNMDHADVVAFVAFMEDGFVPTSTNQVDVVEYRDDDIVTVNQGVDAFQKSR